MNNILVRLKKVIVISISFLAVISIIGGCNGDSAITDISKEKIAYTLLGDIHIYEIGTRTSSNHSQNDLTHKYILQPEWVGDKHMLLGLTDGPYKQYYIVSVDIEGGHIKVVAQVNQHSEMPSLSPDNKMLAFVSGDWSEKLGRIDYKLCTSNIDGTNINVSPVAVAPYKPSWSANGKEIAVTGLDNSIYIINYQGGNSTRIVEGIAPSFSPDGKKIAFFKPIINSKKSALVLLELSTMKQKVLIGEKIFDGSPQWTADGKSILYQRYGMVILPPEKTILEMYSIEKETTIKILEVRNKIDGFSLYPKNLH